MGKFLAGDVVCLSLYSRMQYGYVNQPRITGTIISIDGEYPNHLDVSDFPPRFKNIVRWDDNLSILDYRDEELELVFRSVLSTKQVQKKIQLMRNTLEGA